ncbi:hypothetical protein [Achromobacter xylosoxidans]|uniref:hypothetical protein n=1 Tax=Alcaligenes xylosoxydans xylosoxydans TaxID=85698 RepID=UPI001F1322AC|nr:hypothetical protein [Achromobacter xylosoxidans]
MSAFVWVILIFTAIEVVGKLLILAADSWQKPSRLVQVLDICVNMGMAAWAIALLAKVGA